MAAESQISDYYTKEKGVPAPISPKYAFTRARIRKNEERNRKVYDNQLSNLQNHSIETNEQLKRIYTAKISMEVRALNLKEIRNQIIEMMEKAEGFLESQSDTRITMRVPAARFEGMVKQILSLGIVLDKQIFSYDVSTKYSDIMKRLEIAQKAKKRLLEILKKVTKVQEKIRIIEEIRRLTREIESYEKLLTSLDSFIEYSLIEVLLQTSKQDDIRESVTPFRWIDQLTPDRYTLRTMEETDFSLPEGFIRFDRERYFLARSPGGNLSAAKPAIIPKKIRNLGKKPWKMAWA